MEAHTALPGGRVALVHDFLLDLLGAERGFLEMCALSHGWRQWNWIGGQRVDAYIGNSATTQRRIQAYFGRESQVVHPPVETGRFDPAAATGRGGDHYVVLSELMPHKRIDVAVRAFNELRRPLIVAGDGPDIRRLPAIPRPTLPLLGPL